MKANVGKTDRVFRVILGIVIASVGLYFKSWWGIVAIVPIATAYFSFCPLYALFGMNTCSKRIDVK